MPLVPFILLILTALFSGATVLSIVIAIRAAREQQTTLFPFVREVEGIRYLRARLAAMVFLILTGLMVGSWIATQQNPENILVARQLTTSVPGLSLEAIKLNTAEEPVAEEKVGQVPLAATISLATVEPILPPTSTPILTPQTSPAQVALATSTSASAPAPVPAVRPSPTTSTEAASVALIHNVSDQALPAGVQVGSIQFTTRIDDRYQAVNPQNRFTVQTDKVYAVFSYAGMRNGLPVSVVWYYQGQEILRDEYEWQWGSEANSFAYVRPQGSGIYQVELKIGAATVAIDQFEVNP